MLKRFVALSAAAAIALAGASASAQIGSKAREKEEAKLKVGSAAPALSIEKWVKGDEVKKIESGKVYVVEFWATWCPPCIESIPHLTELQKKNKDVVFIGVAASESPKLSEKERLKKVEDFVKEQGKKMDYRVAFDADRSMSKDWMEPAGQGGIPCAFVVSGEGKIAWIGHPGNGLDKAIEKASKGAKKEEKKGAMLIPAFEPTGAALAAQDAAKQEAKKDEAKKDEPKKVEEPAITLWPGDKAPALQTGKFVKGTPVTSFEKGRVYVVEFWATWCGPCIKAIPHLTELAKEYKDKATFVGVSVWESDQNAVEPFVAKQGEKMDYVVAFDDVPALPEGTKIGRDSQQFYVKNGKMSQTWMAAAGRRGIPSSFIVNGEGQIAWIGSPFNIDEPLKQIVEGKFDTKAFAKKYREEMENEKQMMAAQADINRFMRAVNAGDTAKMAEFGNKLVDSMGKNAQLMNQVAWSIVDPENGPDKKDLDLAMRAAVKAADASEHKDAAILDTLARVYFCKGDVAKAIEIQTKAVGLASGEMKEGIEKALEEYKAAKGK